MKMTKLLCLLCGVMLVVGMLFGCTKNEDSSEVKKETTQENTDSGSKEQKEASSEPVTISFLNWGSAEGATKDAFLAMNKGFEEKTGNIKIENINVPYGEMLDNMLVRNASKDLPDVAQVKGEWISALYSIGALMELDDLLPKETLEDYNPNIIKGLTYDGKLVAAPWSPTPVVVYYNKTLLEKAGISEPPESWDDMIAQAEQISKLGHTESGLKIYGFALKNERKTPSGFYFLSHIWSKGGSFIDDHNKVILNSAETNKAFEEADYLIKNGIAPESGIFKELRNMFAQGQVGFIIDGDFGYSIYLNLSPKGQDFKEEIGIMPVPEGYGFMIEHDLAIFNTTEHANEAAMFIDYLSGPEGMTIYNDNNGNKNPSRKSVEALDFYQQPENAHMKIFIEALKTTRPMPAKHPMFNKAMEELAEGIQRVVLNKEKAEDVVPSVEERIQELYEE